MQTLTGLSEMKTALVVGATGLVGRHLVDLLLQDRRYTRVKIFVRRAAGIDDESLEEHIVDFDDVDSWKGNLTGDDLFSALGTTARHAGSQTAQYKVDFTYQYEVAKAAAANGVDRYFLVSSPAASPRSRSFYLRTKGELEAAVSQLPFRRIAIFQPSILVGEREEHRRAEALGGHVLRTLARHIPALRPYRPIDGRVVAKAIIKATERDTDETVSRYRLATLHEMA